MILAAAIALCGAVGVLLRFGVQELAHLLGLTLPTATFLINVVGSFAIGLLYGESLRSFPALSPLVRQSMTTGLLGGFTTFSAFSLESIQLWGQGKQVLAVAYAVGSPCLGIAAAVLGILVMR